MRAHQYALLFVLAVPLSVPAQQNEIEPNEDFTSATAWTYGQSMSGSECNPPSFDTDYFRIVLPTDGVISFTVTSQGTGPAPGNLQFALFPKSGVYQQYHTLPGTFNPTTQVFSHSCLSGDTMYVRVQEDNVGTNSCISYEMNFTVTPAVFSNDNAANDDFANPQPVVLGAMIEGHLDFLYDASADHFGLTLPTDGMLRIIAEAEHPDTALTGTMQIYVNVDNSYHYASIGALGVVATDTFDVPCIAAQLVTVRVQNDGALTCGISYRLRFEHTPHPFANDAQPNDDFANPQPIALNTSIEGHLDHYGETTADHYGLTLPDDGTLLIIGEAEQYGPDTTGVVEVYVDMNNSYAYIPVGAHSTAGLDTFRVECLRAGAVTVRLQPNTPLGCGIGYRVRFELVPPEFGNDPEPNDDMASATIVAPDTDQDGHITYIGTSPYDHFKLWKPFAGTMRVIFASSTEGPSPALNVWTLNANVNENITTGVNGQVAYDTALVTTANPDTIILRVNALDFGYCGSYRFRYESGPLGMEDATIGLVGVRPNPSPDGSFTITAPFAFERIEVRDAHGRSVHVERGVFGRERRLDLSQVPAGVYSVRVADANGRASTARIIRH